MTLLPTALSVGGNLASLRREGAISVRSAVPEELPGFWNFGNHIEVEIGDQHFIFGAASLREDLSARIAEVTLAIELADVPRLLATDAIDRSDKISIRHRVRGLLQFPKMFGESGNRGGRIENNFGAVHA